jgi:uncharacterized protein (TIGR03435 family)
MHLVPTMNFPRKSLLLIAVWVALASPMAFAQSSAVPGAATPPTPTANVAASAAPAYDVATIKPHSGVISVSGLMNQPDGVTGTVKLPMLVQYAYGLRSEDQVSGTPGWAKDQWFDVQAKMSETDIAEMQKLSLADSKAQRELMLQALLSERFKLKTHSETKQLPVYELVVAKGGSKLIDSTTDTNPPLVKEKDGKPLPSFLRFLKDTSIAQGYPMSSLADFLSQPIAGVGRPVLDKTGLTGTYNFTLNWSPTLNIYGSAISSSSDDAPSIFGALGEVGLKLQPATGQIETIVIDHAEKPSEN